MVLAVLTSDELEALLERAVRRALEIQRSSDTLTTTAAARLARRSAKTIRRWIATDALPANRRGRSLVIRRSDLERFLAGTATGVAVGKILSSLDP